MIQDMYPSIPEGSLPSCGELDHVDVRPDTPESSVIDDVDWNDISSLDDAMCQLNAADKHLSRVDCYISQLAHDDLCDSSPAVRLMPADYVVIIVLIFSECYMHTILTSVYMNLDWLMPNKNAFN